jgi:hypothetical protein
MTRACQSCGAVLPDTADAFCGECRRPLDEDDVGDDRGADDLTSAGNIANVTTSANGLSPASNQARPRTSAVRCPCCGQATESLKTYPLLLFTCLIVVVSAQRESVTGCPRCVRRLLLKWGGFEILAANVAWPFVILPLLVFRVLTSYRTGHTDTETSAAGGWLTVLVFLIGFALIIGAIAFVFSPAAGFPLVAIPGALFLLLLSIAAAFNL